MDWRLLVDVPAEDVRRLVAISRRRTFDKGDMVFHAGDPADSLHLVTKGRFAIRIATPLGDSITIGVRGPSENFGEMALVDPGAHRSATVQALEPAETQAVHYPEFERLRAQHPQISQVLIAFLAGSLRRQNQLLLESHHLPAERRLLRRLAELAVTYADANGAIELTQDELAQMAGTSRATVNRVLRDEERQGTLELRRGRTIVVDADALARRAR